jgi:uncharacterized membrane-anchored protein
VKGVKAGGLHFDSDIVTGLAVPALAFGVWVGVRRLQHSVGHKDHE